MFSNSLYTSKRKFYNYARVGLGITDKLFTSICNKSLFVWSNEIFPTYMRARGMLILLAMGRVGTTASPWVIQGLATFNTSLPFIAMGVPAIIAVLLGLWLPETKGK